MEWLRLIGVAVVVAGFALRLRVTVIVLAAGIATWLVARALDGGAAPDLLSTLGRAFVDGRIITLVVLALPALGLLERYGLQDECRRVIVKVGAATAGRILLINHLFRTAVVAIGMRVNGHVMFSRPLIVPMAIPAAGLDGEGERGEERGEDSEPRAAAIDRIKGAASASDNYANFFGQNLFFGAAGVALVVKNLESSGHPVDALTVAKLSIPMAVVALLASWAQYALLDRWLRRRLGAAAPRRGEGEGAP
ncbi:MAG TPA: DUF969 family protein [Kofleriaceae bacterium]|nr:DUF969 family protein [Kofleriaceae bacterium]